MIGEDAGIVAEFLRTAYVDVSVNPPSQAAIDSLAAEVVLGLCLYMLISLLQSY